MKFNKSRRLLTMTFISISLVIAFGAAFHVVSQQARCKNPELQREVYEESSRPKSRIDYSKAVRFKLGSRKTVYRSGEMITLNLAMLNISGSPVFVHKLSGPFLTWRVRSEAGQEKKIMPYLLVLEGVSPRSYEYLDTVGLATGSLQLVAGCDVDGLTEFQEAHRKLHSETNTANNKSNYIVFERGLFVSWGDACLQLTNAGTYTITAEMTNDYVIGSPCEPKTKTAVGIITSEPLTITIAK